MPFPQQLRDRLPQDYLQILDAAELSGNFTALQSRYNALAAADPHMQPYTGEKKTKYYKSFVQTVTPKIVPEIMRALAANDYPEIRVTYAEMDATRHLLGMSALGSPADLLYGFTSQRYANWGPTLEGMGFRSACMTGQGEMVVTMAERYLELDGPLTTVEELQGAIGADFWESIQSIFSARAAGPTFFEYHELLFPGNPALIQAIEAGDVAACLQRLQAVLAHAQLPPLYRDYLQPLVTKLVAIQAQPEVGPRKRSLKKLTKLNPPKPNQEQIALRFLDEGKFIQKLLGGLRVEHVQSNVKMVANLHRGNKGEIDSIYRVIGKDHILLVEAKDKPSVSKTQLYQAYEIFRLRLPASWKLDVIACLRSEPPPAEVAAGFNDYIELLMLRFDDSVLGKITESILAMRVEKHFRWKIRKA